MRARLYRPAGAPSEPLTIFVHGGGWTFGSIDTHDGTMRNLAAALGCAGARLRLSPRAGASVPGAARRCARARSPSSKPAASARRFAAQSHRARRRFRRRQSRPRGAARAARCGPARRSPAAALFYGCYAPDFRHAEPCRLRRRRLSSDERSTCAGTGPTSSGPAGRHDVFARGPVRARPCAACRRSTSPPRASIRCATTRSRSPRGWPRPASPFRCDHVPGVVHGCLRMTRELDAARRMIASGADFITSTIQRERPGRNTTMERRDFLKLTAAAALAAPLARPAIAQTPATVRWWYHFDNPQNSPAALVAEVRAGESRHQGPGRGDPVGRRQRLSDAPLRRLSSPATARMPRWCACPGRRASQR